MPLATTCDCTLCKIEVRLFSDLSLTEEKTLGELLPASPPLHWYSSVSALLLHLRTSNADAHSDELLRELLAARASTPAFIESLLVLAFLPMLHRTIRRVAKHHPGLSQEDVTQQLLSILLQFLRSKELASRQSHFAFAISRAVKRNVFAWANREGGQNGITDHVAGELLGALAVDDPFEQYALLRHFLHRCATKGLLTDAELDLLIQFKLDGGNEKDACRSAACSSNAVRQRLKRLLAKLRRLAR
jgi:DNA-directed RNA polymerase specialized sigma24 family protein